MKRVKKGFELNLGKENPYSLYIQEVVTKYDSEKQLKIPGVILSDVQQVLGHDADIVVAANAHDTGVSVVKAETSKRKSLSKSPRKTIVLSASPKKTIVVEDSSPRRKSMGRVVQKSPRTKSPQITSTPRTLTLGSPSKIIVSP